MPPDPATRPASATFHFRGDLPALLPPKHRAGSAVRRFCGTPSVKDAIESQGIPHTEVGAILVEGRSVDFAYRVRDGDEIDVFGPDLDEPALSPPVPRPPRFILDGHLGRLAGYLRMLGFDTAYTTDPDDDELARRSVDEDRVLVTRDRGLLRRAVVRHGYLPRSDDPVAQAREVVRRYGLAVDAAPFSRCIRCNGLLEPVDRAEVLPRLLPKTRRYYDAFRHCRGCDALYWSGSHMERMQRLVASVLEPEGP